MNASDEFKQAVSRLIARVKLYRHKAEPLTAVLAELLLVKAGAENLMASTRN